MSTAAFDWAWERIAAGDVGRVETKLVLLVLADHADPDGECYPSRKRIARMAALSARSVTRHVGLLEERGLLERVARHRSNGSQTSTLYRLKLGGSSEVARGDGSEVATPEPSVEPTSLLEEEEQGSGGDSRDEFDDWLAHYHETTGRSARGSKTARAHFNARRRDDYSLDDLKLATIGCHGDDFCRRNGYDRPETILSPSKVDRYIALARDKGEGVDVIRKVEDGVPQMSTDGGKTWATDWETADARGAGGRATS
jgi:DNA-binding transcriptional ArsR family regulator